MATQKKSTGRDYPLAPTPPPQQSDSTKNGEYYAYSSGKVGRIKNIGDKSLMKQEHMSMDTTGYAAGKQNFKCTTSTYGGGESCSKPTEKNVSRKDVPSLIDEMKKGARIIDEGSAKSSRNNKK
jgi:hypothetical protein